MTTHPRASAFYNPHLLSREELIAGFIARQPLLDLLLDDLRRGGGQHHLLVGVRGTGKTTLLLRLGVAIDDDEKLAKKVIALRFAEEQYNVSRPSDFWLNCVDALIDALERREETVEVRRLEAEVVQLDGADEAVRSERALGILQQWSARARKLMVLLVDNLDLVLDRLPEHHWALRKVLGSDRRLVLVGASSTFLPESFEYGSAFYEFFNVHELGALDEAEARRVLTRLAEVTDTPDVTRVLVEEPSRLKAVLQLSGGTPRTLALLHGVLAQGQSTSAERDLQSMLDMVTPYYKARFEDLATQSQLIVDAVALHWHPMSAAECAAKTGLEISLTSAQLTRLVRSSILEKVPGEGSKLAFQLAERLFNIWYMMRASRRLRRQLFWVAASIQAIYGQEEVERRATALLATPEGRAAAGEPAQLLAFAALVKDEAVRRQLECRAIAQLVSLGRAVEAEMDLSGEDSKYTRELWEHLFSLSWVPAFCLASTAGDTVSSADGWPEARSELSLAIPALEQHWFASPLLWRPFVRVGDAGRVAELLRELDCHERALPLYEALLAAADRKVTPLLHLAPELRGPAEQMLAGLLAPDRDLQATTATPPAHAYSPLPAGTSRGSRAAEPRPALKPTKPRKRPTARRGWG